jgi:UDP-N-acetylmuramyl pentapeptide phosphotransferase/UDP-N-acetylglucosamine-1-phosphate transferase
MEFLKPALVYTSLTLLLFALILIYFRVARKYNIIDVPNERSSHSEITIRGGGVIFPLAFLLYALTFHDIPLILLAGLLAISVISFIDDISELSVRTRMTIHLLAVTSLIYTYHGFDNWSLPLIAGVYILVLGGINAYNFMDGVNGITGLYSLVVFASLLYLNRSISFTDSHFIALGIISCLVFLYFNFRKRAKCFAGDVGSVSLAFWIISLIGLIVVKTSDFKYVLFLSVYGLETVLTIIHRLYLRQNILKAHRLHLYQILANENRMSHLWVAVIYASIQLIINAVVIFSGFSFISLFFVINIPLCLIYVFFKGKLISRNNEIR